MPRPVPSIFLLRFSSILRKVSYNLSMSFSLIPIPVSSTEIINLINSFSIARHWILNLTLPLCVYFIALVRRFDSTCLIRTSSPYNLFGISSAISSLSSSPISFIFTKLIFTKSLIKLLNSYSPGMISIFPDSIFEKSKILLTRKSNVLLASLILEAYSISVGSSYSLNIISFIPNTTLIGVLISWDILATNSDFA